MKILVDLNKCADHGQCVFSAPKVFSLDADGKLSFRHEVGPSETIYISAELDASVHDDVEEAADACPLQAIDIEE